MLKRVIGICFTANPCNLECSYCYVHRSNERRVPVFRSMNTLERAFSEERLGGKCFINISSAGEPLLHKQVLDIIEMLTRKGHYVMLLSNGTLTGHLERLTMFPAELQKRIFVKFSFHYVELKKKGLLDVFMANVDRIKNSDCSCTVELMGDDITYSMIDEIKNLTMSALGCYPHISIPRDERQFTLGIVTGDSFERYIKKWKEAEIESDFFDFKAATYGKHIDWFCYAGNRSCEIDMETGEMRQCYHTPVMQNFFDFTKEIDWNPVGNHCCEPHCYVSHMFMPLGIVEPPNGVKNGNYFNMRNRYCLDGKDLVKPSMKKVFEEGVEREELSEEGKSLCNEKTAGLNWEIRTKEAVESNIALEWLSQEIEGKHITNYLRHNEYKDVAIYGYGRIGRILCNELQLSGFCVKYVIDKNKEALVTNRKAISPTEPFEPVDAIIITPIMDFFAIKEFCKKKCNYPLISVEDIIFGNTHYSLQEPKEII